MAATRVLEFSEVQPRCPTSEELLCRRAKHERTCSICFLDKRSDDLEKMTWLHHCPFLLCFVGALGWHEPLLRGTKARGRTLLEGSDSLLLILENIDIPRVVVGGA